VGGVGIEDKLSLEVKECFKSFIKAGIKLWMITGDKLETALNIAISSELFS
jgi:P-type E1-E2 ATPase